jgi:hypothetical protein
MDIGKSDHLSASAIDHFGAIVLGDGSMGSGCCGQPGDVVSTAMNKPDLKVLRPKPEIQRSVIARLWALRNEAFTLWVLTSIILASGSFALAKYNKCLETHDADNLRVRFIMSELKLRSVKIVNAHERRSSDKNKWIAALRNEFDPEKNFIMHRHKGRSVTDLALEGKIIFEDWDVWARALDVKPDVSANQPPAIALHSFVFGLITIQDILDQDEAKVAENLPYLQESLDRLLKELPALPHPGDGYIPRGCLRRTLFP